MTTKDRLINAIRSFTPVWPFYAGALMAYDVMHHFWWNFWIMLVLSTGLAVILVKLDQQRVKAIEMLHVLGALLNAKLQITAVEETDVRRPEPGSQN